jgi:hypothetical protein
MVFSPKYRGKILTGDIAMLYETTTQPGETLKARIEPWKHNTGKMLRHFEKMIDKWASL